MPFGNPLDSTPSPQAAPQAPQPPAFRAWADAQIGQMSGGTAKSWDDLDAAFDALPAEPGKEKKDVAGQIKRDLLKSYTDSVLPQYYQDPKALHAAKAYAESQMAPHIMASAFKPLVAAAAAPAADKTAAQQDKFNELIERRDNAAESAKAAIHLDKLKRLNGQKYIKELGLADMDTDLAVEFIKSERDKRVAKSLEIEQQYAAGQVDHATAQGQLDQLYRESQNLEGAEFSLRDNAGWVESGAYLVGGVAKGLIAVPEIVARAYSGTVSGLSGDGFGKGWQEEASVGGFLGSLSEGVTEWQQDISKYDPEAVAQQYMMQAFDQGGMTAGLDVLRDNPEVAWEMLSTSGVDSIATFFTGGLATKGARIAGNLIVDGGKALPRMLQAAPSLKAMKDVMVGATKAANTSRGANAAFTVGSVAVPSISAGLTDARESGTYLREQLDTMGEDKFLSLADVQAERAVWSTMDATRRAEYIANKKDDMVGQMMAEQTAVISAGLMASGYVGSKFGLEKFLLGSKAATGAATKTATSSALKAAGVQGVLGGGLEMGEEVGETRAQHLFVNSYLDRDTEAPTPFDNYAGAAVSGFIVGGPLDAVGGYMQAKKESKAAADLKKTQEANAAFAAASGQVTEKDLKAARDAENKRKAGITAEVMSQIAAENAARAKSDATPQTWTGGSFVDKDGSIVTKDAQKFTDAELEDTEIQGRIDTAFAEFNKDDDPYSAMAILTAPDGMGLTGKQRSDLEVVYRIASDPKETDKVLQYRAKVEVLAMTNRIRLSELGKQSRDIRDKALGARRQQMPPTSPNQVAGLLPAPPRVYAPAEPNITPPLRLENSPTYYPMADASFTEAEWSQELPQFQDQLTGGIEYGEAPEFYADVYEVLGLPPPPREPIDTRGADGLQNFPQDQFAARRNQQIDFPIVDAQRESDPLADVTDGGYTAQKQQFFDALENAYYAAQEQQAAAAQEQPAEEITPLPSESRTAIALAAGIPAARATVTVAASTNEDSTLGVQVVAYEDGSMGVIMSGDADGAVRIHTMEIDAVVDAVTKTTGNNDPLNATQLALNAITNRIKQTGVKTKGLIPAIRLAVANAVMRKVDSAAFAGKSKKAKAKQAATMLFLQRTIEEDRARVLDGSGRTALEYVTGIRDTLPKKHQANATILDAARIKWHETDALLRKTGLYNTLDAAGHKAGVGKPKPAAEIMPIQAAREVDISQTAALAANDAANSIVAGGSITVEQAEEIVAALPTPASDAEAFPVFHPHRYGWTHMDTMPLDDDLTIREQLTYNGMGGGDPQRNREMQVAIDAHREAQRIALDKDDLTEWVSKRRDTGAYRELLDRRGKGLLVMDTLERLYARDAFTATTTERDIKDAVAAYESDQRTLRWKELKTREDALQRAGQPVPERTAQEKADSAWTKAERKRIARIQIGAVSRDALDMAGLDGALRALTGEGDTPVGTAILSYTKSRRTTSTGTNAADMQRLVDDVSIFGWVDGVAPFIDDGTKGLATLIDSTITDVFKSTNDVQFDWMREGDTALRLNELGIHRVNTAAGTNTVTVARGVEARGRTAAIPAQRQAYTVVHEQLHRASTIVDAWGEWLSNNAGSLGRDLTTKERIAIKFHTDIKGIHAEAKRLLLASGVSQATIDGMYGMDSPREFIAELARPEFRAILNELQTGKKAETLLHKVMRSLMDMLGVRPGTSLDKAMTALGNMWRMAELEGNAAEFFRSIPAATRAARAAKAGIGTEEFDAFVAATLDDTPINGNLWSTINDPMDGC